MPSNKPQWLKSSMHFVFFTHCSVNWPGQLCFRLQFGEFNLRVQIRFGSGPGSSFWAQMEGIEASGANLFLMTTGVKEGQPNHVSVHEASLQITSITFCWPSQLPTKWILRGSKLLIALSLGVQSQAVRGRV